jgi:hypothetical protein
MSPACHVILEESEEKMLDVRSWSNEGGLTPKE